MTKAWMNALQCIGEALDLRNLDREPGRIFITEASSDVGQRIASQLINAGYALVRIGKAMPVTNELNAGPCTEHIEDSVVDFSWNREETYANALIGVKSVIITIPYIQGWYKHFSAFIKACKNAHVKHFVKLSFYLSHIPGTRQIPFVKHHTKCDELLMNMIIPDEEHVSQMSYTIIAPSHFMSNPITYYSKKLITSVDVSSSMILLDDSKNRSANYISPNDVAKAVSHVALSPHEHYNQIYTIMGPELISNGELATLMIMYFGKQIKCTNCINFSEYRIKYMESNAELSQWYIRDRVALQQVMASGLEEAIVHVTHNDFYRICGHAPETFYDYLTYSLSEPKMEPKDVVLYHV